MRHSRICIPPLISIHSLRVEGDRFPLPERRYTGDISIHSLRVEGDSVSTLSIMASSISIHSLRVEGDSIRAIMSSFYGISIHSLRVEGDSIMIEGIEGSGFQSTPSVWRETFVQQNLQICKFDFNPLPPCGGRRGCSMTSMT